MGNFVVNCINFVQQKYQWFVRPLVRVTVIFVSYYLLPSINVKYCKSSGGLYEDIKAIIDCISALISNLEGSKVERMIHPTGKCTGTNLILLKSKSSQPYVGILNLLSILPTKITSAFFHSFSESPPYVCVFRIGMVSYFKIVKNYRSPTLKWPL